MADRLHLTRAQRIELSINVGQRRLVVRMRVSSASGRRHYLQRLLIEFLFTRRRRIASGNSMDGDLLVAGDLRRPDRWHLAAGVVAIGEDNEHTVADALVMCEDGECQADGTEIKRVGSSMGT